MPTPEIKSISSSFTPIFASFSTRMWTITEGIAQSLVTSGTTIHTDCPGLIISSSFGEPIGFSIASLIISSSVFVDFSSSAGSRTLITSSSG